MVQASLGVGAGSAVAASKKATTRSASGKRSAEAARSGEDEEEELLLQEPVSNKRAATSASKDGNSASGRPTRLSFQGKLYAKGITTDKLLRELNGVKRELALMEQETVNLTTLQRIGPQLVQPTLMLHKDKGVRAAVACCLADLLRLFAPDAPFTSHELKVSAASLSVMESGSSSTR